jgi:hypothetical protein
MGKRLMLIAVLAAMFLGVLGAPAAPARSAYLSQRSGAHALRANLGRAYGIRHVHVTCTRRSRSKLACSWRGRRTDGNYRGGALVSRSGGSTVVQLSNVRRAG